MLLIDRQCRMTIIVSYSKSEMIKVYLEQAIVSQFYPYASLGSLGATMASKFMKAVHFQNLGVMSDLLHHYLNEFLWSYQIFSVVYNTQYKSEALHKGFQVDNNSFIYEFALTSFLN